MLDRIKKLEQLASQLEPSPKKREAWRDAVLRYGDRFMDELPTGKAYYEVEHSGEGIEEIPIPENGRPVEEIIEAFAEHVEKVGLNPASGGHFGYIPGGGIFPSALGDYLAAVSNKYAGLFFGSPGAVRMERFLIKWLCELFGYPEDATGNLTSGGSIANLIGLTTARDAAGLNARDYHKAAIYLTRQTHHCVQKSLRLAGLREASIRYIPVDDRFRMKTEALEENIQADLALGLRPLLIVGSAGTTDTGIIDPLDAIADIAEKYNIWFHIDAAYGGFFLLVDEIKPALKGIERSDSLAVDPHKSLFLPYGSGAVLVRNTRAVYQAHHYHAAYLQDVDIFGPQLSPADVSPELTKHYRGLRMWLPLQLLGVAPFRAALLEKVLLCRYFHEKIQISGFEVGPEPMLSTTIFRYVPKEEDANVFNEKLVAYIRKDGRTFMSTTMIEGVYWIRLTVLSFRTHLREVDLALELLAEGVRIIFRQIETIKKSTSKL